MPSDTTTMRALAAEGYGKAGAKLHWAADEIDRLRAELAAAQGTIQSVSHHAWCCMEGADAEAFELCEAVMQICGVDASEPPTPAGRAVNDQHGTT